MKKTCKDCNCLCYRLANSKPNSTLLPGRLTLLLSACVNLCHNPLLLAGGSSPMFPNSSLKGTRLEVRVFWEVFGQENVLPISTLQEDEGKIILARLQWEYLREGAVVLMLADDSVNPAANRNLKVSKSLTNEKFAWKCVLGKFEPTRELLVPIDTNKCAVS